jgi:hypothetical protein
MGAAYQFLSINSLSHQFFNNELLIVLLLVGVSPPPVPAGLIAVVTLGNCVVLVHWLMAVYPVSNRKGSKSILIFFGKRLPGLFGRAGVVLRDIRI